MSFYSFMYRMFASGCRWLFGIRTKGRENAPKEGGYLVAANHLSIPDVIALEASFDRQVRLMAKAEIFRIPILSGFFRALGAIPLDRGGSDVGALKKAIAYMKEGDVVGIFPQGHRYPCVHPSETPIKAGAAMIAFRAGVPIVPVSIRARKGKVRPFSRVLVTVGEPIMREELDRLQKEDGAPDYMAQTRLVFDRICAQYDAEEP